MKGILWWRWSAAPLALIAALFFGNHVYNFYMVLPPGHDHAVMAAVQTTILPTAVIFCAGAALDAGRIRSLRGTVRGWALPLLHTLTPLIGASVIYVAGFSAYKLMRHGGPHDLTALKHAAVLWIVLAAGIAIGAAIALLTPSIVAVPLAGAVSYLWLLIPGLSGLVWIYNWNGVLENPVPSVNQVISSTALIATVILSAGVVGLCWAAFTARAAAINHRRMPLLPITAVILIAVGMMAGSARLAQRTPQWGTVPRAASEQICEGTGSAFCLYPEQRSAPVTSALAGALDQLEQRGITKLPTRIEAHWSDADPDQVPLAVTPDMTSDPVRSRLASALFPARVVSPCAPVETEAAKIVLAVIAGANPPQFADDARLGELRHSVERALTQPPQQQAAWVSAVRERAWACVQR